MKHPPTRITAALLAVLTLTLAAGCGTKSSESSTAPSATMSTSPETPASASPAVSPAASPNAGKSAESPAAHPHWSYSGETGPEHWAELEAANTSCASGKEQSPINIETAGVKADPTVEPIKLQYQPTVFTVMNNGHTIQANAKSPTDTLTVAGVEYKLAQFHFHLPSEHQLNAKSFDMELHLVHKSDKGELAVIGVMLKGGAANPAWEELWSKLPKAQTTQDVALDKPIDLTALLPKDQSTYRYNGSLTTPPCSQPVKWIVMQQPMEVSADQVNTFKAIFPDNHRPVQPLNGRQVTTEVTK